MGTARSAEAVRAESPSKWRHRSKRERRQVVEETLQPGASVAVIARQHGVNANQVFSWRKQYQAGRWGAIGAAQLVPVQVAADTQAKMSRHRSSSTPVCSQSSGMIHIELRHAQVHIEGEVDAVLVRTLLECLRA